MNHQDKDGKIDWLSTGMFLFMFAVLIFAAREWSRQQTERLKRSSGVTIIIPKDEDMKAWNAFIDQLIKDEHHVGPTDGRTHERDLERASVPVRQAR